MADAPRTEKPTAQRVKKARDEGRFPVSREFVSGLQFTVFVALIVAWAGDLYSGVAAMMRQLLLQAFRQEVSMPMLTGLITTTVLPNLSSLALIAASLVLITVATQLGTTQFGIAAAQLAPQFSRLNPLQKLKGLPRQNVPALVQAVLLIPLFGAAIFMLVQPRLAEFLRLPLSDTATGAVQIWNALESLLWKACFFFMLLGSVDLFRQRHRYMADLKMSMQEIKEEHKQNEGDPHVKGRIRRLQRDLLRRSMMKEIPTATAVITNPTHFAIAIRYSMEAAGAPTVVAKGKNYLAQRIKARAAEHNIPLVENPPLAQALYKSVDVGQEIPPNLYRAVAEVLAYIFRLSHPGVAK